MGKILECVELIEIWPHGRKFKNSWLFFLAYFEDFSAGLSGENPI